MIDLEAIKKRLADAEFITHATDVLKLVSALEAANRRIAELEDQPRVVVAGHIETVNL